MRPPVDCQDAYVLHRRPYRETSALVDYLTRDHGRVSAVVRGVRGTKQAGKRTILVEPFVAMSISWRGRSNLVTTTRCDALTSWRLSGDHLIAGLYVNELLVRILGMEEPMPTLFEQYAHTIPALASGADIEGPLRVFERVLLEQLGYGIEFTSDVQAGAIAQGAHYQFNGEGFERIGGMVGGLVGDMEERDSEPIVDGATIIAIERGDYADHATRRFAKYLFRRALRPHLGNAPLRSRALFAQRSTDGPVNGAADGTVHGTVQ